MDGFFLASKRKYCGQLFIHENEKQPDYRAGFFDFGLF